MNKKGASIISLAICALAITLVTTALVVATNNSAIYNAELMAREQNKITETSAYTEIYSLEQVTKIARQAFVDNYLSFFDKQVNLEEFIALVMGDIMEEVPSKQLNAYDIIVTEDGVDVIEK